MKKRTIKKYPQYDGDPFPLTEEEMQQRSGSNALTRAYTKYNKSIQRIMERYQQRNVKKEKNEKPTKPQSH